MLSLQIDDPRSVEHHVQTDLPPGICQRLCRHRDRHARLVPGRIPDVRYGADMFARERARSPSSSPRAGGPDKRNGPHAHQGLGHSRALVCASRGHRGNGGDNLFGHLNEANRFSRSRSGGTTPRAEAPPPRHSPSENLTPTVVGNASAASFFPVFCTAHSPCDYWELPIQNITLAAIPLALVPGAHALIGVLNSGTTLFICPRAGIVAFWNAVNTGNSVRYNEESGAWQVRCNRALDARIQLGEEEAAREFAIHPEDVSWAEGGMLDGWCTGSAG